MADLSIHVESQAAEANNTKAAKTFGGYHVLETLGKGSFGKVKLVQSVASNVKYAMKIINKKNLNERAVQKIAREIRILSLLDHPNIVKLHDVFESNRHICIVTEYIAGGELFDYILVHHRVKEREAKRFFRHVAEGVEYCHSKNVIHRDLKPENLLLTSPDHTIKIIDFGLSNIFQTDEQLMKSQCGSPHYTAPEVTFGGEGYGTQADIFSMGVILFALVCGYLPFDDPNHEKIFQDMRAERYTVPPFVSDEAADLISKMLRTDSRKRASIDSILNHIWLVGPSPSQSPESSHLPAATDITRKRHIMAPLPDALVSAVTKLPKKTSKDLLEDLLKNEEKPNEKIKTNAVVDEKKDAKNENVGMEVKNELKEKAESERLSTLPEEQERARLPTVPEEPEKEAQESIDSRTERESTGTASLAQGSRTNSMASIGYDQAIDSMPALENTESTNMLELESPASEKSEEKPRLPLSPEKLFGLRRRSRAHTEEPGIMKHLRIASEPKLTGKKPPVTPTKPGIMGKLTRLLGGGTKDSISDSSISSPSLMRKGRLSERRNLQMHPVSVDGDDVVECASTTSDPHFHKVTKQNARDEDPESPVAGRSRMMSMGTNTSASVKGSRTPGPSRAGRRLFQSPDRNSVQESRTPQPRRSRVRRNTDISKGDDKIEDVLSPVGSGPL